MGFRVIELRGWKILPNIEEIKAEYGLSDDDLDPTFGSSGVEMAVYEPDTYLVRASEEAATKMESGGSAETGGQSDLTSRGQTPTFSDLRIEPTGPLRDNGIPGGRREEKG